MKSLFTRHGILILALGLSLLFNIFVLVGFVQSRASNQQRGPDQLLPSGGSQQQREPEEAVVKRVTRELKLDDAQQKSFAELHTRQRAQALVFDASMAIVRQDMSDELAKDSPDPQRLQTLIGQEADLIRDRRVTGAELMGNFATILNPEQRKMFARRVGLLPPPGPDELRGPRGPEGRGPRGDGPDGPDPRNAAGDGAGLSSGGGRDRDPNRHQGAGAGAGERRFNPGPEIMRRFDVNKNGRLDPDEAQAARQELEARRREFVPGDRPGDRGPDRGGERAGGPGGPNGPGPGPGGPREVIEAFGIAVTIPLWRWFDQDNDGRLSDAEQQTLREFTESHPTPQRPQRDREGAPLPPQN